MSEKGYTAVQAKIEAHRCLMCADAPCSCDCPAGIDARSFIRKIRFENLDGAVRMLRQQNVLAGSCSYICPTGALCGKKCSTKALSNPIDIRRLQRFAMDYERSRGMIEPIPSQRSGAKIAVIGSGPAGLGCAAELALRNHAVTVYEKDAQAGGLLRSSIPLFRLPADVLDFDIEFIKKLGVEFQFNSKIDNPQKLLKQGYKAVFIAAGLEKQRSTDIINSKLPGVYEALDFLHAAKRGELPDIGKRAIVIGGGDTALDAARVVRKSGSECLVLYRRTQSEMPAYPEEIDAAWDEGVEFYFRTVVRAVTGTENVTGVRCVRIRWHERIRSARHGYDVEGQEFQIACDSVIIATGQEPASAFGLRTTPNGMIAVDKEKFETSAPKIFAGGDIALGGGTAAAAVGKGKQAAIVIDEYVKK